MRPHAASANPMAGVGCLYVCMSGHCYLLAVPLNLMPLTRSRVHGRIARGQGPKGGYFRAHGSMIIDEGALFPFAHAAHGPALVVPSSYIRGRRSLVVVVTQR